ncbi:Endonuclease, Uma2 family (restriction endonuclease fold) [Deinococcus reticulitermitis]|uniref:Endonuclease, Uma2 family (Restriction endonuclease fold) n=1 Tax=Deinococcus reticulitermitis TaxID=856736 RepID=A0A1H6Y838_9DEIO|nr:Uma2 family endonuclease [Deinococcus reticulitermitis]SEJ37458.1 Endonuclease, Uma2 family (restriction endonuclease fold) [Deinococcus reticulitermitis]
MTEPAFRAMGLEEYLRSEEHSPFKREYVAGFVYPLHAQAGVSQAHSLISMNTSGTLFAAARRRGCRLHMGEVRLQVGNAMFYPDVMLVCADETPHQYFETRPCLLVEVLSPSTVANDRVGKYAMYTGIASLQTYLIVEQTERRVYEYQRAGDEWRLREVAGEGEVGVPCLNLALSLDDIYGGVIERA